MDDELVLRHVDEVRRIRVFAAPELAYPEQYIFCVAGEYIGRVFQTGPNANHAKMYARVLEGIERGRAKVREDHPYSPKGIKYDAVVIAWSGDMDGDTLRRLSAAEVGARDLARWSSTRTANDKLTLQDVLIDSLFREADPEGGAGHMTRVRALCKLADIFDLNAPEPATDEDGGVVYADAISMEFAPTEADLEVLREEAQHRGQP